MQLVVALATHDFFRAYRIRNWFGVFQALRQLSDRDLLACLNFLGPRRVLRVVRMAARLWRGPRV